MANRRGRNGRGMRSRTEPLFEAERLSGNDLSPAQDSKLFEAAMDSREFDPNRLNDGEIDSDWIMDALNHYFYNTQVNDDLAADIEDLMVERDEKGQDPETRSAGFAKDNARSVIKHWQDSVDDDPDKMGDLLSSYEGDLVAAMEDHYDDYLNGQLDTFENRRDGGMRSRAYNLIAIETDDSTPEILESLKEKFGDALINHEVSTVDIGARGQANVRKKHTFTISGEKLRNTHAHNFATNRGFMAQIEALPSGDNSGMRSASDWTKTRDGIEMDAPDIDGLYEIQGNNKEGFVVTRYSDAIRNGGQDQQEYEHDEIFKSRTAAKKWAERDYDTASYGMRSRSIKLRSDVKGAEEDIENEFDKWEKNLKKRYKNARQAEYGLQDLLVDLDKAANESTTNGDDYERLIDFIDSIAKFIRRDIKDLFGFDDNYDDEEFDDDDYDYDALASGERQGMRSRGYRNDDDSDYGDDDYGVDRGDWDDDLDPDERRRIMDGMSRRSGGMRSRVTAGEIGALDSDRTKSKRNPPPLTDREKEIVDLVDAPRKFELEDRESLEIQIANHIAKTRDAIYDAILTGDINENEASEFIDEMSSNLTKPLNVVYGNEPNWRSSNESNEFLDDFMRDAEKRFKRAAETYSSVRKLRKNRGNAYGNIADTIIPLNEYLDGKGMDGHSLLGSYPSGQPKLESVINNYVIDEIEALIENGEYVLDANHEEAYEEFANSMREMVGNLNPEDYPSGLAESIDKALEYQKEWFFDSINTLIAENANARADAVMRGIGMRSRMAPSSGRIRAAEMEISARPQGMASRRSEGLKDPRFAVPGRDRVDPSDGQLWNRLSDEEKATVANRAVNRERMLLNEFKQRFPRWWDRASKEADKKGWDKDLMKGGNAGWLDELHRFVTNLADDPNYPEKSRADAEKQFNDLQALFNMRVNRGSHDLLEHLNPTSRRYLFDDARRDDSKKTGISASGKEMKTPSTAPRPFGEPIDVGTPIREQVGQNQKKPMKERLDAYYKRMSDKILYSDPARQARREMRKARRRGINAGGFTESEANPVDDAKRRIRRRKRLKQMRKNRTRDVSTISDSSTSNRIDGRLAHTDSQGSLVFGDKLTSTLATMMTTYRTESKLKKTKGSVNKNRALAVLWDGAGYNGTPHVITAEEFKTLHAAGWVPVVRGHGNGSNGVRYANDWIDDPVRFITGQGGEAQGEGEYWARATQGGGGWFTWMDGSLPAGTVGLLPPSTRRVNKAELRKIQAEHAPLAKAIKAFDAGLPTGEREKMNAEEYVDQLRDHLRGSLGPIYESTMSTKMGQMTSKILESLSGSSDSKKQELLDSLEFLELISKQGTPNSYAPLLGYDTIMADSGVELIHNRTAITVVGDTFKRDDAVNLAMSKA